MKVLHLGEIYLVQFGHRNNHKLAKSVTVNGIKYYRKPLSSKTYCKISKLVTDDIGTEKHILAETISTCIPEDQFVKDKGRRLALQQAINDLEETVMFPVVFKRLVWDRYNSEFRLPRKG